MQHKPKIFSSGFINILIPIILRLFSRMHICIYRYTRGRVGARIFGNRVLLLTTVGRRSGKRHTTPLAYLVQGKKLVIIGGAAGSERVPDWWLNLQAYPFAEVQPGERRLLVQAIEATAEQQLSLWKQYPGMRKRFDFMQKRMRRRIPVVILWSEDLCKGSALATRQGNSIPLHPG